MFNYVGGVHNSILESLVQLQSKKSNEIKESYIYCVSDTAEFYIVV